LLCRPGSFRTSLAAESDDRLPLLVLRLKIYDAIDGMIGDPEGEPAIRLRFRFEPLVEKNRHLPGFAQPADDAQLAGGDHRLFDEDVGHGGHAAGDQDGSG
jgi:hypothetical protein